MLRYWLAAVTLACVLASAVLAKQGIVKTRNGQTIEGDISEKAESVVVNVRGIQTEIRRDDIVSIEYPAAIEEEYPRRLAALDPKDADGHIALARWAFGARAYDQALDAIERALRINPNDTDAVTLRDTILRTRQLERQNRGDNGSAPRTEPRQTTPQPRGGGQEAVERKLLTATDINRIRQKELTDRDSRLPFRFQNNVLKRFADAYNKPDSFFRASAYSQAMDILATNDAKFTEDVIVTRDPETLITFKRTIQPMILNGCATAGCHNPTAAAGGFFIYTDAQGNDPVTYTNFYILVSSRKTVEMDPRTFGSGPAERKLIDRTHPSNSLLAQYGLPRENADLKHPAAGSYNGVFRNRQDQRYRNLIEWMGSQLVALEPAYGIEYTIPTPSTQPATQPAGDQE